MWTRSEIWHYGHIIINQSIRIGKNRTIYPDVEIRHKVFNGGCHVIGDIVFNDASIKIFINIKIGNNMTITANAVVLKIYRITLLLVVYQQNHKNKKR